MQVMQILTIGQLFQTLCFCGVSFTMLLQHVKFRLGLLLRHMFVRYNRY